MWLITALSYLLLLLTLPISYWWCVVTLAEHDRMVIFRLGKMQGARGPGKVGSININIRYCQCWCSGGDLPLAGPVQEGGRQSLRLQRAAAAVHHPGAVLQPENIPNLLLKTGVEISISSCVLCAQKLDIWSMHCR